MQLRAPADKVKGATARVTVKSFHIIENDIRPFVLGRKNCLFSGSPRGAYTSCAIYSLIQTAKANGLDAYSYLRYLFEKLATITDEKEIVELAPHKIDMV